MVQWRDYRMRWCVGGVCGREDSALHIFWIINCYNYYCYVSVD